ncbi:unnamed protein product [Ranitomeya imitator]|uniref:Uncharacterized protein n=1 Tax=Ranitomeya imitator TaxID=111125 RepID=A0ABN9LQQ3_9NEOB|nr:unnamed protein product [Ranitomeya imitator]
MWSGYSASAGSVYLTPEEQLRRLAYCMKLLPSPLYKKERLMPTNPEAQRRFAVRDEERPAPSINIRAREERKREEEVTLREMLAYLDEEEDEKGEKEEDEMAAMKIKLDIRLPRSSTRRSRTRPHNVRHQVSQASPMTWKTIMWTFLLGPLCRYIGIIGPANIFRSALQIIEGTCTYNRHYSITEIQFKTDTKRSEGPARKLTNYEEKGGRHERWMVTIAIVIRTSHSSSVCTRCTEWSHVYEVYGAEPCVYEVYGAELNVYEVYGAELNVYEVYGAELNVCKGLWSGADVYEVYGAELNVYEVYGAELNVYEV